MQIDQDFDVVMFLDEEAKSNIGRWIVKGLEDIYLLENIQI